MQGTIFIVRFDVDLLWASNEVFETKSKGE